MADIKIVGGFCFGVKRATVMIEKEISAGTKSIFCIGELIHNRIFTDSLRSRGVTFIDPSDIASLPEGATVFIRTHGIPKSVTDTLDAKSIKYTDATCPFVKKIHTIAENCPEDKVFIVVGDAGHPEVEGIISRAKGESRVCGSALEVEQAISELTAENKKAIFAVQTTYSQAEWDRCRAIIEKLSPESEIFDTICNVTETRQKETRAIASESELTVVVGGKNSSNTQKLFEVAKEVCGEVIKIESAEELDCYTASLRRKHKIAIAAGASTPDGIIQEVYNKMANIANEELSFAEMLEQTFKTLNTGERVTGIVSAVNPAEIKVDLGTKHTGILPYDEITDDSGVDLNELFKVGDEIEVICGKFSDSDGTVLLSKKKIDQHKYWDGIKAASESGESLTGTIKEIVKNEKGYAGVIIGYGPNKVFIPASQTGIPKGEELDSLKGQTVNFRIIDVNDQRKRAVGSIKSSARATRKAAEEEFYNTAKEGDKFEGKVRALTNYGAFIDLGPVDGMLHISEMTWGRLKKPSEIFKEGDVVSVYIKAIDKEAKRISLGYKTEENDPWNIFQKNYKIGDVVDATVVSIMPFGAFAEIFPDFDGLIHISQISDKPVSNPASVLKVGDKVTVKITAADFERRRLSLSIKALLENDVEAEAAAEAEEAPVEVEAPAEEAKDAE